MSNQLEMVKVYYTIKINFPEKKWVRTDEPEDQGSREQGSRGGEQEKKYGRGVIG